MKVNEEFINPYKPEQEGIIFCGLLVSDQSNSIVPLTRSPISSQQEDLVRGAFYSIPTVGAYSYCE